MITPYENQRFASMTSPVLFQGCTLTPHETVFFYADTCMAGKNGPECGAWSIGGPTTYTDSDVRWTDAQGYKWYCYQAEVTVPYFAWKNAGGNQVYARVKSFVGGRNITYHYQNTPENCAQYTGAQWGSEQIRYGGPPCAVQNDPEGYVTIRATW